jgi:hypothetical protein
MKKAGCLSCTLGKLASDMIWNEVADDLTPRRDSGFWASQQLFLYNFSVYVTLEPITVATLLRHELSSPARTLVSWVRIPLKAWMSVCIYPVFVLFCVYVAAWQQADPPYKEYYLLCKKIKKLKKRPRPNKGL